MIEQDQSYHLERAEAELSRAACAEHPAAMRAHYHLAGFYLDKAYGVGGDGDGGRRSESPKACPDDRPAEAA